MNKSLLLAGLVSASFGLNAQTYYSQDFEGVTTPALPANATSVDSDGDGEEWYTGSLTSNSPFENSGQLAISRSWNSAVLTPDNLMIIGPIDLSTAVNNVHLQWQAGSIETTASGWYEEHYAVYVTTSSNPATITGTTPVFEETLPDGQVLLSRDVDVSSFMGQAVYVTFRHYNCTDENILGIDNLKMASLAPDNAALNSVDLARYAQVSSNTTLTANVQNVGSNPITSLTIDWNDGTSHSQTITGLNIAPGGTLAINHPDAVTYASATEANIVVAITAVNGGVDPDITDNGGTALHNTVSALEQKNVVIEEGTGTWCGWCPRGTVAMEYMSYNYPDDFIGIAVHNGDPMTVTEYDNGAAISGFPGANVDRAPGYLGVSVSSSAFEQYYNERVNNIVPAGIDITMTGDGQSSMTFDVTATFRTPFAAANYRLGVIVVEDDVTGTGSQYAQANYYSSTSQNIDLFSLDGTNWKNLANPVPATDMVYDHVGRALLGGYNGQAGSVPATITDGQVVTYSFNYTVPGTSDASNMYAVAVLIDQNTGEIVNAASAHDQLGVSTNESIEMSVYPNPASDVVNVGFEANGDYIVTLTDLSGRVVYEAPYNNLVGSQTISVDVNGLTSGNYILGVSGNGSSTFEMVSVK